MVYIRSKHVKGIDYAYLVKSEWDNRSRAARQVTIKYLGRASDVELEDIPSIYRNDPKIMSFLSTHNPQDIRKKSKMIETFQSKLFAYLSSGNSSSALALYKESRKVLSLEEFYDRVLRAVMYDVGTKWEKGELDITTEHIASNTAQALISSIIMLMENTPSGGGGKKNKNKKNDVILICCPDGELHNIPVLVIESVLRSRGFRVINASPSSPSGSILHYVNDKKPDMIMISATLPENVGAAKRLATEIAKTVKNRNNTPALVLGGSAFRNFVGDFPDATTICQADATLEDIVRLVRRNLPGSRSKK